MGLPTESFGNGICYFSKMHWGTVFAHDQVGIILYSTRTDIWTGGLAPLAQAVFANCFGHSEPALGNFFILIFFGYVFHLLEEFSYHFGFRNQIFIGERRIKFFQGLMHLARQLIIHAPARMKMLILAMLFEVVPDSQIKMDVILSRLVFGDVRQKLVLNNDGAQGLDQFLQFIKNRLFRFVGARFLDRV